MKEHSQGRADEIVNDDVPSGEFGRPGAIQSLVRGLRVLSCFDMENPAWTLSDLARRMKLHRATVHRFVKTLEAEGFLAFDLTERRYHLGSGVFQFAHLCNVDSELARLARSHMERLVAASCESVALATWLGDSALFLDMAFAPRPFWPRTPVGQIFYDVRNCHNRVFLAYMPESARSYVLAKARQRLGEPGTIDLDRLCAELDRAAVEGVAFDLDGSNPGVCAVGTPIHNATGRVKASLGIVAPSERFGPSLENNIRLLRETAAALSRDLGYRVDCVPRQVAEQI